MKELFAYGADYGWVSQLEAEGITWTDEKGTPADPVAEAAQLGLNAIRLRVFVDPPAESYWVKPEGDRCMLGFCDKESVLAMSRRIKAAGLKLMIDFHYSDHFADPEHQDIPEAWKQDSLIELKEQVASHTRDMLLLLREHNITPDWVQVGNEINKGLLWPVGDLQEHPGQMVELLNAGYDAVKEICADCPVITHVAGLPHATLYRPFLDRFFAEGGRTDMIGFSYYPYWYRMAYREKAGEYTKDRLREAMQEALTLYHKPVMIVEIGESDREPAKCRKMLRDAVQALKELPDGQGHGIFYWEPEVATELMPDSYPLGAAELSDSQTLHFTDALKGYFD